MRGGILNEEAKRRMETLSGSTWFTSFNWTPEASPKARPSR
jgi:hypothetical protein